MTHKLSRLRSLPNFVSPASQAHLWTVNLSRKHMWSLQIPQPPCLKAWLPPLQLPQSPAPPRRKRSGGVSLALSSSPLRSITSHKVNTYFLRSIIFIFRGLGYNSVFLYHCAWFFLLSEVLHSYIMAYFSPGSESYSQTNFIFWVTTWSAPPSHRKWSKAQIWVFSLHIYFTFILTGT